jgi:hypothetical protein
MQQVGAAYGQPPMVSGGYSAPPAANQPQGQYGQPQAPQSGMYGAPAQTGMYGAPQNQAAAGYGAPPAGAYGQAPPAGMYGHQTANGYGGPAPQAQAAAGMYSANPVTNYGHADDSISANNQVLEPL